MKIASIVCGAAIACACTGCLNAPFQPPPGAVSIYSAPLSTEGNWTAGTKTGTAEALCVLGLVAVGDCSLNAAIKNGDLKRVDYVDYKYVNVFGIYQSVTVNAVGE